MYARGRWGEVSDKNSSAGSGPVFPLAVPGTDGRPVIPSHLIWGDKTTNLGTHWINLEIKFSCSTWNKGRQAGKLCCLMERRRWDDGDSNDLVRSIISSPLLGLFPLWFQYFYLELTSAGLGLSQQYFAESTWNLINYFPPNTFFFQKISHFLISLPGQAGQSLIDSKGPIAKLFAAFVACDTYCTVPSF